MNDCVKGKSAPAPRGRPRSEQRKQAILQATRELLDEGGPGAVTMEAVAERAGVGKPTVYRWFPDRHAVAMAALMSAEVDGAERARPRRSQVAALRDQLRTIVQRFSSRTGRHVTALIAASDADSELSKAFRSHFVLARRAEGRLLLERAVAAGELRTDLDLDLALDLLYGPLFFRLLVGHAPLDEALVDGVLALACEGMRAHARKPARRRKPEG